MGGTSFTSKGKEDFLREVTRGGFFFLVVDNSESIRGGSRIRNGFGLLQSHPYATKSSVDSGSQGCHH